MGKVYSVSDNDSAVQDSSAERNKHADFSSTKSFSRNNNRTVMIDFSPRLIIFILLVLALLFYAKQLILIVMFLFFGFVVMSSIKPVVNWFMQKGFSKGWAIVVSYIIFTILILSVLVLVFVPFINQLADLVAVIPNWIDNILYYLEDFSVAGHSLDVNTISGYATDLLSSLSVADNVKNLATFVSDFFTVAAFLFTSIIFSIYLVSEHDSFLDILLIRIVSDEKRDRVKKLVVDVERKLGGWVLGQAVVSFFAGVFSGIILSILGVPFALPLAIFAGFMSTIPSLGSNIAGIVMTLVALVTVGPIKALVLLVAYILYQPFENSVIVPKVMGNAVGLKPAVVMLGVIIFLILFGIIGGFIAVPAMVIMKILYEFYVDLQKLKAKGIV